MPDKDFPDDVNLESYVAFLEAIPNENAIARRFIGAAHLLARGILVKAVFAFIRSLDLSWEETAEMTGDILNLSRSSVARSVKDVDRLLAFLNASGFYLGEIDQIVEEVSDLTKRRLADALEESTKHPGES